MVMDETSAQYLYRMIKKLMVKHEIDDLKMISRGSGVPASTLSSFLGAEGEINLKFEEALTVTKYFNSIEFLKIMESYCLKLDDLNGIVNALEFASNYNQSYLTDKLIAKHQNRTGLIKDWVTIYSLNSRKREQASSTFVKQVRDLVSQVSTNEMKIRLQLMETEMVAHDDYKALMALTEDLNIMLYEMDDSYLKESFKVKIYSYFATAMLYYKNDQDQAIEYANYLIQNKITPMYLMASAHLTIGQAFLFEEQEASLRNIRIAIEMFHLCGHEKYAQQIRENDLMFVQNYHEEKVDLCALSGEELAHQLIVRKQYKQALAVLKLVEKTSFSTVYQGIASKDRLLLEETLEEFLSSGMYYFANYVERELMKLMAEPEPDGTVTEPVLET
ncbi:flagellar biosynthesis regulator FlbT [Alkalihalobacillus xiaoxiensis]|uniref:Flagellar biosynthesis regulator FlbT n=1 Tax=Shouchella xiaoxiensis TaxID=766895 RepID=A0ABS2SU59_9BACI|nr:AimR family lysis-lysogeny pheromone receptor [Shouchella xiaoxiensis]MBM7839065.1 flagellar biosynthesis regulator FlbT [Shouchella xiaoxiensis]